MGLKELPPQDGHPQVSMEYIVAFDNEQGSVRQQPERRGLCWGLWR